jgi:hypothetical protein
VARVAGRLLCHPYSPKGHYVAVVGAQQATDVQLVDTDWGIRDINEQDLKHLYEWDGTALLLALAEK